MNTNSKGKKGGMPSVLFNCMKEGAYLVRLVWVASTDKRSYNR